MKSILEEYKIIGVLSEYQIEEEEGLVKDLPIKNIENALKMVGLNTNILNRNYIDLSLSEKFKIDIAKKLDKDVILVGSLSKNLIRKDINYIKKLLLKLSNSYGKKIIVFDKDITSFFDLAKQIVVIQDKNIIYKTSNFYDEELYNYTNMPKIIEFIKYINTNNKILEENIDIYELIKDVYRCVS